MQCSTLAPSSKAFVGVLSPHLAIEGDLKRWALLFERLAVPNLAALRSSIGWSMAITPRRVAELERLEVRGILFQAPSKYDLVPTRPDLVRTEHPPDGHNQIQAGPVLDTWARRRGMMVAHAAALQLRQTGLDACAIHPSELHSYRPPSTHTVAVVIKQIPVPDNTASWEAIATLRQDSQTRKKLLRMRMWMRKAAESEAVSDELGEELRDEIHEYREHLEFHRLPTRISDLEAVMVTTLKIEDRPVSALSSGALDLVDIKPNPYGAWHRDAGRPGSEVAYIHHAVDGLYTQ